MGIILLISVVIIEPLIVFLIIDKKNKNKKPKIKLTKEEKEKLEQAKTAFENLMNYDYESAVRGEN